MATLENLEDWLIKITEHTRLTHEALEDGGGKKKDKEEDKPKAFFEKISDALSKVSTASIVAQTGLTSFASTFDKVISSLGGGMAKFVEQANPAAVFKFSMAVENAMSAVGRILLPALERSTLMIQQLGNAIESLSPQAKQLIGGLAMGGGLAGVLSAVATAGVLVMRTLGGPVTLLIALASAVAGVVATTASGQAVMESFGKVMKAFGTVIEVIASALMPIIESVLVPAFTQVAVVMEDAAVAVMSIVNALRSLIGLNEIKYDPNKNNAQAVRSGQFGDLRGAANRAYASAYNSSTVTIAESHFEEAKKHTTLLGDILNKIPNPAAGFGKGLGKTEDGTEVNSKSFIGSRLGAAFGDDSGAAKAGRAFGGLVDLAAEPFVMPYRWLGRMSGVLV